MAAKIHAVCKYEKIRKCCQLRHFLAKAGRLCRPFFLAFERPFVIIKTVNYAIVHTDAVWQPDRFVLWTATIS